MRDLGVTVGFVRLEDVGEEIICLLFGCSIEDPPAFVVGGLGEVSSPSPNKSIMESLALVGFLGRLCVIFRFCGGVGLLLTSLLFFLGRRYMASSNSCSTYVLLT